ncbi:hypothetical protein OHB41_50490 [Streptomyces sp. NBC_01571]|uniref:hypothetical protein n=1 Tax=Streptomyces sp. NBC_01571 TaxID=2975883 RepID=UPI002253AFEA|nr:hypothetical protein [Streptomyces sp. NBC_01571]MCX4581191.1 hypothetical protein [Streptomyces sp. NBC_01571]
MHEAYQRQIQRERGNREAEDQTARPGEDHLAFLRRMDDLKYKRPDPMPPASMSKNANRLPLFWLAYFAIPIIGTWLLIHILDWWERF